MKRSYFTGLSKNTFLLALTSFFADVSTEMLYPVLPIFLTQILGVNASIVGLVEGVATATQNIVQGFSGWLSDKIQDRKKVALIGYSLAAVSKPFMGIASVWQGVFTARFLDRLGTGTRSAPRDGMIAASATEENRGKAFGLEGIGDNAGAFVGPLLAIFFLFVLHTPIRSIFYIAFIPALLAVLMVLLVKETHITNTTQKIRITLTSFSWSYWKYLGVIALFGLGTSSTSFLILQTRQAGAPFILTIFIYALYNGAAALISYPSGFLSDKLGRKNILLLAFGVFLITYIGFAMSKNILILGALFVLYGTYQGIFRAVGKAFATDFVTPTLRASGIGWYSTVVGLSSLGASIIAGQLWVRLSPQAAFVEGVIFASLGILGLLLFISSEKKTSTA